MSHFLNAFNYREWARQKLQHYEDFAERVTECNQREFQDFTEGQWFYIPDNPLPTDDEGRERRVIYNGSWGNFNSPGASSYTYANIYFMDDEDDVSEYEAEKKFWQEQPEEAAQDMECLDCHQQFERSDMEWDDRQEGYVCEGCQVKRDNPEGEEEEDGKD